MQASSLSFLAEHNFDFNTCIREGVPHMPACVRDRMLASISRPRAPRSDTTVTRSDIVVTRPEDATLVAELITAVTAWLKVHHSNNARKGGPSMDLLCVPGMPTDNSNCVALS